MIKFKLERWENPKYVAQLREHIASCPDCKQATSIRSACAEAGILHENLIRDTQKNYLYETHEVTDFRSPLPWHEVVELPDMPSNQKELATDIGADLTIEGVDVSSFQGNFPWNEAVNASIGLGIAKASEGNGFTDPSWGWNIGQLLAPGPIVGGSYHFGRPDLGNTGTAEAKWYLSRHPSACFDPKIPWVFVLDAESAGGSSGWAYEFLDVVSTHTGYSCWFYSYANWITTRGVKAFNRPLWIAWPNPGDPPAMGWPTITMHQYGLRNFSVGGVDANRFFGNQKALFALAGVVTKPIPDPPSLPPKTFGGKVLAFHDTFRWDYVFIRDGKLIRRWGNSISGIKDGHNSDDSPVGEVNEGSPGPGVKLLSGTEWVSWEPSGTWLTIGGQGSNGQQYYFWGQLNDGNMSGWQKIPDTIADIPSPGPSGPPGPPTFVPHTHKITITETESGISDGGAPS